MAGNSVDHPEHYASHPSGAECIEIAEWFSFNLGNVIKYVWRAGKKGDRIEDLKKARWYLEREIEREEDASNRMAAGVADPIITAWGSIDNLDGEGS